MVAVSDLSPQEEAMPASRTAMVRPLLFGLIAIGLGLGGSACVSGDTYELAKKDAENARLLYQNEQRQTLDLVANNKRLKQQIEELDAALRETKEKLARINREWLETRDELLRLKIEREQRRSARHGESQLNLDTAKPDSDERAKRQLQSEDPKRRLKEILEELQGLLQQ
jgi:hypothetical protein